MKKLLPLVVLLSFASLALANTTTINFEQYPLYTQITNQYAATDGVVFTNALQLVAPFYDYFDFPPHSGSGVITNDPNDPIQVNFTHPSTYIVSAWYADPGGIQVTAYSSANAVLASVAGAGVIGSDLQFKLSSTTPISYITISDAGGNPDNMIVDDLSFATPEPSSLALLGSGVLGLAGVLRRRISR